MIQILDFSDEDCKITMINMMRKIDERWRISPES